jgi:hypothetical protein
VGAAVCLGNFASSESWPALDIQMKNLLHFFTMFQGCKALSSDGLLGGKLAATYGEAVGWAAMFVGSMGTLVQVAMAVRGQGATS